MAFPKMFRVKQELEGPTLHDIPGAVRDTMRSLHLQEKVKPGQTVAITSGSRGVANIDRITRAVVDELKALGLQPFVCPTMGSHGEATAEGQLKILAHYGITEATMGCPLKSSMEVVEIGKVKGTTVFCDKNAWGADHIVVVGRIKAHTDFDGEIESGLYKMMAIGLGKQHGAKNYHRAGHHYSYGEIFPLVGQAVDRPRLVGQRDLGSPVAHDRHAHPGSLSEVARRAHRLDHHEDAGPDRDPGDGRDADVRQAASRSEWQGLVVERPGQAGGGHPSDPGAEWDE